MPRVYNFKAIQIRSISPDVEFDDFNDEGAGVPELADVNGPPIDRVNDSVSFGGSGSEDDDKSQRNDQEKDHKLSSQDEDPFLFEGGDGSSEDAEQIDIGPDAKPDGDGFGGGAAVQGESGDVPASADIGEAADAVPVIVDDNADFDVVHDNGDVNSLLGSNIDNNHGSPQGEKDGSGSEFPAGDNSPGKNRPWPGYRLVELYNVDDPSKLQMVKVPWRLESCTCDEATGFWCTDHLVGVDLVTLCRALNLDPRTAIHGLDIQYPWTHGGISMDDNLPSEMDFEKREDYRSNPDPCAWDDYVHSLGVFYLHATPESLPVRVGFQGSELPGWIAPVVDDAPGPVANPKPLDVRPIHPSTSSDDSPEDEDEDSDDDFGKEKPQMNFNAYEEPRHNEIFYYLMCKQIPTRLDGPGQKLRIQRKQFRQNVKRRYQVDTISVPDAEDIHKLYYVNGSESAKRKQERTASSDTRKHVYRRRYVPRADEIDEIIAKDHTHSGHNASEMRLRDQYLITNLRQRVESVHGDNCPICDKFKPIKKIPTRPILTSRRLQMVQFDLTKFYVMDEDGFQWILVVVDHFTKYCWAEAFVTKESLPIAEYLADLFMHNGVPERWHADNGGEFTSAHMDAAREVLMQNVHDPIRGEKLTYSHGMPRNPRCQGLVERLNQTLKTRIHKQLMDQGYEYKKNAIWKWRPTLKKVVFELNRTHVKLYGVSPHILLYGFAAEVPDHRPLRPEQHARLHLHCANMQRKAASKKGALDTPTYFQSGDAVMVHALKERRSHHDLVGKNAVPWPATATIVNESSTNRNYYKIKWTSRGIDGKEKGQVAHQLWPHWCLKKWLTGPGKFIAGFPIRGDVDGDSGGLSTSDDASDDEDGPDQQNDHVSLTDMCLGVRMLWHAHTDCVF